jgi:arabinofuranosyltransferase
VAAVPVATGLVHALFVVKVGGDFMHARLLLPAVFAVLCPFAVVSVPARRAGIALVLGVAAWALVCAAALRVPYDDGRLVAGQSIVDERAYYLHQAGGVVNPVTQEDYDRFQWEQAGSAVRARAARGERSLTFAGPNDTEAAALPDIPARPGLPVHMVAAVQNVGLYGYAAGTDAWVVDRLGLGDPIAARIELGARGRPGHEKLLPPQWVIARFGAPDAYQGDAFVADARKALGCSVWRWDGTGLHREAPIRQTLDAVSQPLTPGRFVSNLKLAATGDKLRFPPDPPIAADAFCGPFG